MALGKNYADHAARDGRRGADHAADLPQAVDVGHRRRRRHPAARRRRTRSTSRASSPSSSARPARNVAREDALRHVLGYTAANDVTARDQQRADGQFTRAKGYDSFCPLGPWIETVLDPSDLRLVTRVNGEVKQDGRTSQMIHDVATQIAFISSVMTLLPGDVILTGTPAGVGPIVAGDIGQRRDRGHRHADQPGACKA